MNSKSYTVIIWPNGKESEEPYHVVNIKSVGKNAAHGLAQFFHPDKFIVVEEMKDAAIETDYEINIDGFLKAIQKLKKFKDILVGDIEAIKSESIRRTIMEISDATDLIFRIENINPEEGEKPQHE